MNQTELVVDEYWTADPIFNEDGKFKPRRVLAVGNGFVLYSDGGKRTKEVTQQQFQNWIKRFSCVRNRYAK